MIPKPVASMPGMQPVPGLRPGLPDNDTYQWDEYLEATTQTKLPTAYTILSTLAKSRMDGLTHNHVE